jgi:predicted transcriptional regulator
MPDFINLSSAQLEIMEIIWSQPTPISAVQIEEHLSGSVEWKRQTLLTFLERMTRKGFLLKEKQGKECFYTPLVSREDYVKYETNDFMEKFHKNSFAGFMNALFSDGRVNKEDIAEIEKWLDERK